MHQEYSVNSMRRSIPSLVLLCFLFSPVPVPELFAVPMGAGSRPQEGPAGEASPAHAAYQRGLASLKKGSLDDAERAFDEALRHDPRYLDPLLGLADVAAGRGKTGDVKKYLERAQALAPAKAEVQTAWGRYFHSQQRFSEAESAFKKAIALDPKAFAPRVDLGTLYAKRLHQPEKAIETLRSAIEIDPAHAGVRYALGMTLGEVGKIEEAKVQLEEAARLDPKNPLPYQAMGDLYAQRKELDKALDAYAKVKGIKPGYLPALIGRGDVFILKGDNKSALAEYAAALTTPPRSAHALLKIGMVHQVEGRIAEARKAYLEAISIDPKQALAYNNLAYLAAGEGKDLDNALTWAKKAVALAPGESAFLDTLGWVHHARGESKDARTTLEKAASGKSQDAETYYHLGVVYAEAGDHRKAVASLEKALSLNRDFPGSKEAAALLRKLK